jgi:hypothetical protein
MFGGGGPVGDFWVDPQGIKSSHTQSEQRSAEEKRSKTRHDSSKQNRDAGDSQKAK